MLHSEHVHQLPCCPPSDLMPLIKMFALQCRQVFDKRGAIGQGIVD